MNEILKETKTNVIEKQILVNQMAIMSCLQFNNRLFGEILEENINMTFECLKTIDEYDSLQARGEIWKSKN